MLTPVSSVPYAPGPSLPAADYTVTYKSGGPQNSLFKGIRYRKYNPEGDRWADFPELPAAELRLGEPSWGGSDEVILYFVFESTFLTTDIEVNATLDGQPWTGTVDYTIQGPTVRSGSSVPQDFSGIPVGTYTITLNSGGPPGAVPSAILPSDTEKVSFDLSSFLDSTTTFTLAFESQVFLPENMIDCYATLDGREWEGPLEFTISSDDIMGQALPQNILIPVSSVPYSSGPSLPVANYTVTYKSGGPPNAVFRGIRYPEYTESPEVTFMLGKQWAKDYYASARVHFFFESLTSEIKVNATLDGQPWTGTARYTVRGGPTTRTGYSLPSRLSDPLRGIPIGISYTITLNSGGPPGAVLSDILPSDTEEVSADNITTFTLVFVSTSRVEVDATLDGEPWEGEVEYTMQGPVTESSSSVPGSFGGVPAGAYDVTYISGGPHNAVLTGILPSATSDITAGETAAFTLVFESGGRTGEIEVNATLDYQPWSGELSYTLHGPCTESGTSVPHTFSRLPAGTYSITFNSGGPQEGVFACIQPSVNVELCADGTGSHTLVFLTPMPVGGTDLSLTKTVDNAIPDPGDTITYTITVTNDSPDAATGIQVTDVLPGGISYVSDTPSRGTYTHATGIWDVGSIAGGASETLRITVTVDAGTGGTTITNTAEVSAVDQGDPDSTPNNSIPAEDDQDSVDINITASGADLRLTMTVDNDSPNQGDDITYTIIVTNDGPDDASGISVNISLLGVMWVSDDGLGMYLSNIWNIPTLTGGASAALNITATVTDAVGTPVTNTAEVSAVDQGDLDSTPNNGIPAEDDQDDAVLTVQ
jgi:uncharacterized repeat protein (TIGR01451 family)